MTVETRVAMMSEVKMRLSLEAKSDVFIASVEGLVDGLREGGRGLEGCGLRSGGWSGRLAGCVRWWVAGRTGGEEVARARPRGSAHKAAAGGRPAH